MRTKFYAPLLLLFISILNVNKASAQEHSLAREWNEEVLYAISADFARPTVHARNLFHTSIAMYDAWAIYTPGAQTYLLGQNLHGYESSFEGVPIPEDALSAQNEAISFAVFRLIEHRYAISPGLFAITDSIRGLMDDYGYDYNNTSIDYQNGGPAELGNYIASVVIDYGFQDGANESNDYANQYYVPFNDPIEVENPGNPDIVDPNRWQQITLSESIDQSGEVVASTPDFLSPEWGEVLPFAMTDDDMTILNRDGHDYKVYHDPGAPAFFDYDTPGELDDEYKWNFMLVSIWASHLSTEDPQVWDISPASVGNIQSYPETQEEMVDFYNLFEGGDPGTGYDVNPVTGEAYEPQYVLRADYARVLAEFWADGPNSVTPPGHWFDILNEVSDHPMFERKWKGLGPELPTLEYDVKSYLAMGGAMHDAAIAAWSIKGYYDYIRPVSAIRYLCELGQCSDSEGPNYNPLGAPLVPGYIELVAEGDPLAGDLNENVNKIKLYTWRGPDFIDDPETDIAGVGWILAENWWPYQRPSFVTPPFAGYVSGHSTYSRTAAELMTLMTGSAFFPGGMSGFVLEQNEFLVFEEGPSQTIELQWATYQDASDQCSLSRIWGGIHPPIDDIPGRKIGMELGPETFNMADAIVTEVQPHVVSLISSNSVLNFDDITQSLEITVTFNQEMDMGSTPTLSFLGADLTDVLTPTESMWNSSTEWSATFQMEEGTHQYFDIDISIQDAVSSEGKDQNPHVSAQVLVIDTKRPELSSVSPQTILINDATVDSGSIEIELTFDEPCNTDINPQLVFTSGTDISGALSLNEENSAWQSETTYIAVYDLIDNNLNASDIQLEVSSAMDENENEVAENLLTEFMTIDTENPSHIAIDVNNAALNLSNLGSAALILTMEFDEPMDQGVTPILTFPGIDPTENSLIYNSLQSMWISESTCQIAYDLLLAEEELMDIEVSLENFLDSNGNTGSSSIGNGIFTVDTRRPLTSSFDISGDQIADAQVGANGWIVTIGYDEDMNTEQVPLVTIEDAEAQNSLVYDIANSSWIDDQTFEANFTVIDNNVEIENIELSANFASDASGNGQLVHNAESLIQIDTKNPTAVSVSASDYSIDDSNIGENTLQVLMIFDEVMDETSQPSLSFVPAAPTNTVLAQNSDESFWLNAFTYSNSFDVLEEELELADVVLEIAAAQDLAGNHMNEEAIDAFLSISLEILSVSENLENNGVAIFPSPVENSEPFNLTLGEVHEEVFVKLFDLNGKVIASWKFDQLNAGVHQMNLPETAEGMYICNFISDKGQAQMKLFIKN